jgi:hypothetical protein
MVHIKPTAGACTAAAAVALNIDLSHLALHYAR